MLTFIDRYGFFDNKDNRFIGYIYKDKKSKRVFSIAKKMNVDIFYINELDETFGPTDNTYSTLTAKSLDESKKLIGKIVEGYNE